MSAEALPIPVQTASPLLPNDATRRAHNARGIALMALGMFIFAAVDAQSKLLTETMAPLQIVWVRQTGLLLGVAVLLLWRGRGILRTNHRWLQMARGALAATSATCFVLGLRYVPLTDAVAVSFVAPFIVTVLGALLLREPVGLRRWLAVCIGFVGTLVVIRPGTGALHPAVVLVLLAATAFALRQIASRMLSSDDGVATTVCYTALTSSALLTLPLPFVWVAPETGREVALLVSIAVMAAFGELCVISALRWGEAVAVAPLQYTLILWGTGYSFFLFGHLPDIWTWIGTAIIIASGLYTFWRETRVRQRRAAQARGDQPGR